MCILVCLCYFGMCHQCCLSCPFVVITRFEMSKYNLSYPIIVILYPLCALACTAQRNHTHKTYNLSQGWCTANVLSLPPPKCWEVGLKIGRWWDFKVGGGMC